MIWFIHVPKTAGKSFRHFLKTSNVTFEHTHFPNDFEKDVVKFSKLYDFNNNNFEYTSPVIIIRHPFDRYVSEWCHYGLVLSKTDEKTPKSQFVKSYAPFFKNKNINTFTDYISTSETYNTQVKNTLGYQLYSDVKIDGSEVETIIKTIREKKIIVLLFEDVIDKIIKVNEVEIESKYTEKQNISTDEWKNRICTANDMDMLLYTTILEQKLYTHFEDFVKMIIPNKVKE